jgi:hypothetical protein
MSCVPKKKGIPMLFAIDEVASQAGTSVRSTNLFLADNKITPVAMCAIGALYTAEDVDRIKEVVAVRAAQIKQQHPEQYGVSPEAERIIADTIKKYPDGDCYGIAGCSGYSATHVCRSKAWKKRQAEKAAAKAKKGGRS